MERSKVAIIEDLLQELCVGLGFCLSPLDQQKLVNEPPESVDDFTDAVLRAEGFDPPYLCSKDLRRAVQAIITKHLDGR